jgi:hypothetical protein
VTSTIRQDDQCKNNTKSVANDTWPISQEIFHEPLIQITYGLRHARDPWLLGYLLNVIYSTGFQQLFENSIPLAVQRVADTEFM